MIMCIIMSPSTTILARLDTLVTAKILLVSTLIQLMKKTYSIDCVNIFMFELKDMMDKSCIIKSELSSTPLSPDMIFVASSTSSASVKYLNAEVLQMIL